MSDKKVVSSNPATCISCAGNPWTATLTTFADGTIEWQCGRTPEHRGIASWPVGSSAWKHATGR